MSFSANVTVSFSHQIFHKSSFLGVSRFSEYASDAVNSRVSLVLQKVWLMTCNHNHVFLAVQFGATQSIALSNTFTIDLCICKTNSL